MNDEERGPVLLDEYRHRRRPRPTVPPPPPARPSALLQRFVRELVADAIHEHVQELHSGRAS